MKILPLLILAAGLFTGCSTTFYDLKTGKPVARFQGDMKGSHYAGHGVTWNVDKVSHSVATRAGGSVAGTVGSSVVSGITAAAAF